MTESLRGSRLGAVSYENEGGVDFAARQLVSFDCPNGHAFAVPFAVEAAELPFTWECRVCGATAARRDGAPSAGKAARKLRTPWDMLMERRTIPDLEALLDERLELLRNQGGPARADHPDHRKTA
jgi:RNA polymerase-binding protein